MKKNNPFMAICLFFVVCLLVTIPLFISCGSSSSEDGGSEVSEDGVSEVLDLCLSENCTDAQLDNNFERAVKELEEEGLVITLETVSTDPDVYYAIADRMRSIAGVEGAVQQGSVGGVKQALVVDYFEPFDNSIEYCGPDKSAPGGAYTYPHAGECMNRACWAHDDCYDTIIETDNFWCGWSPSTKVCDDAFFAAFQECKDANLCGFNCRIVERMARHLQNWCDYQFLVTAVGCGEDQRPSCTECTPRLEFESCVALGADCGWTYNGCDQVIHCGDQCPDQMPCGFWDGMDNQCIDLNPINLSGTWVGGGSTITIQGSHSGGYTYIGTDGIVYKHQGTVTWQGQAYEGDVVDVEGWCCGNRGHVWIEFIEFEDVNTLKVTSNWYHPGEDSPFKGGSDIITRQ